MNSPISLGRSPDLSLSIPMFCSILLILSQGNCWSQPQPVENELLKELLELKEKEGRDNAIIYYIRAQDLTPKPLSDEPNGLMDEVRRNGWSEKAGPLFLRIEVWRPALDEIRRGAEIGYARQVVVERRQDGTIPIPNFLGLQLAAKMLAVEGRYFESRGEYDRAIENYLTGLKMARDYTQPDTYLINHLIGIAVGGISLRPLYDVVQSGNPDAENLRKLLRELREIENSWGSIMDSFRNEVSDRFYLRAMDDPEAAAEELRKGLEEYRKTKDEWFPLETFEQIEQGHITIEEIVAEAPRLATDVVTLREFELGYFQQPVWERNTNQHLEERSQLLANVHPYAAKSFTPHDHFVKMDTRFQLFLAKLRETQIAAALSLYRTENEDYPKQLNDLTPRYLDAVPVDPFSAKPFGYRESPFPGVFSLFSVGPDQNDDGGEIEYDATNGTVSGGDVFLR